LTQNQKPEEKYLFYAIKAQDQEERYRLDHTQLYAKASKSRKLTSDNLTVFGQK
jgi:hypothetical protein